MSLKLLESSSDPESPTTPFHSAAKSGDLDTLKQLLAEDKSSLNSADFHGQTALLKAANEGHYAIVGYLLDQGASVDQPDRKRRTPLFVAVKGRHTACVEILLEAGANPDGDPGNMSAPMFLAATDGYLEGIELLTKHGALLTKSPDRRFSQQPIWPTVAYNRYHSYKFLVLTGFKRELHLHADSKADWDLLPRRIADSNLKDEKFVYISLLYELGLVDAGKLGGGLGEDKKPESLFESPRKLVSLCRLNIFKADLDVSPLPTVVQQYARLERVRDILD